jgi:hypothetical protein
LLNQFGKACVCFPVGCCGHIVLDYVWLVGQFVKHSLQVREVVEVVKTSCWTYKRLSLGERVRRGKERTPGRNLVAAIEPGDFWSGLFLQPKEREIGSQRTVQVIEKVHSPRVEKACEERGSVGNERGRFLGENPFLVVVCCFACNLSLA